MQDYKEKKVQILINRLLASFPGKSIRQIEQKIGMSFREFRKLPLGKAKKIVEKVLNE